MDRLIFIGIAVLVALFTSELRVESAAWQKAHATFYGGSDASGTMGKKMQLYVVVCVFRIIYKKNLLTCYIHAITVTYRAS